MTRKKGNLTEKVLFISLPEAEKEALRRYAKVRDRSMNDVVREAIKLYIILRQNCDDT